LGPARYISLFVEEALFNNRSLVTKLNFITQFEVGPRLDHGQIHILMARVRDDFSDLGDSKVAFGVFHLGRFEIDDPVSLTLLRT